MEDHRTRHGGRQHAHTVCIGPHTSVAGSGFDLPQPGFLVFTLDHQGMKILNVPRAGLLIGGVYTAGHQFVYGQRRRRVCFVVWPSPSIPGTLCT